MGEDKVLRRIIMRQVLGRQIRFKRRIMRMKRSELASLVGVTECTINMWETGRHFPQQKHMDRLMHLLGIKPEAILNPAALGNEPESTAVGEFIKMRRLELGLSQNDLANKMTIEEEVVENWEMSTALPSLANLASLSEHLELSVSDLLPTSDLLPDAIGYGIRQKRLEEGMSVKELAGCLGVSSSAVCGWEVGRTFPDSYYWSKLSEWLKVEVAEFAVQRKIVDRRHVGEMSIGSRIRIQRLKLGMTQKDLADGIGLEDQDTIWKWETGRYVPRPRYHAALLEILGVEVK